MSDTLPPLTEGDTWSHPVTLRDVKGNRRAVTAADVVRAGVIDTRRSAVLIEAQAVDVATPAAGSDLAQGVVVPAFAAADTTALDSLAALVRNGTASALLVVEVDTAGAGGDVQTYAFPLLLRRGLLD